MFIAGIIVASLGLISLIYLQFQGDDRLAPEAKRGRGIVLDLDSEKQALLIRFTAGKHTLTSWLPVTQTRNFYKGQQVFIDYLPGDTPSILQVLSISEALSKKFLKLSGAAALIILGLILLRLK